MGIALLDSRDYLVGFFKGIARQRLRILLAIPRDTRIQDRAAGA